MLTSPTRFRKSLLTLAALACLNSTAFAQVPAKSFAEMVKKFVLVPEGAAESEALTKATTAIGHLQRMELPQASRAINEALQLAPRNSQLHFLNAFVYHLQAKEGDTQKSEMAIEGYQQALRLDQGNWIAQEFLGLAYLDQRSYEQAKTQFSEVLLITPDSSVSLHGLMVSAYLTGDAVTACAMADQFRSLALPPQGEFLKSGVAVYAACGKFEQAEELRAALARLGKGKDALQRADRRLAQWKSVYAGKSAGKSAGMMTADLKAGAGAERLNAMQAFSMPSNKVPADSASPATPAKAAEERTVVVKEAIGESGPRMVLVDVVLVSAQELVGTSKGVNLLNALTLQLGSISGNLGAYSAVRTSNVTGTAAGALSTAITRAVTIPALSYSLNIANANDTVNEVLAQPTLAAIEGLPSEFFSGTNLSAGVVSTSTQGGTTVVPLEKRFGIKLAVTPTFLPNGRVQMKVDAQRTSLNANVENPKVAYQVEIGEISANANVVMRMGDTLVLSGLAEKSRTSARDGVPVLQDIPVVQYLFSNKRTNDVQRSVLILITPRAPAYASLADGQEAAANASVLALREKFKLPAQTPPNVEAVLSQVKTNSLFREFREGDVMPERWERMDSTGARLRQALDFLYY